MIRKNIKKLEKNILEKLIINLLYNLKDFMIYLWKIIVIWILSLIKKNNKMMIILLLLNKYGIFLPPSMIMLKFKDPKGLRKKGLFYMMEKCYKSKLLLPTIMINNWFKLFKNVKICPKESLMISSHVIKCN